MTPTLEFIRGLCLIGSCSLLAAVVVIRWLQRTREDVGGLARKLVVTLLVVCFFIGAVLVLRGGEGMVLVPFIAVLVGVVFSFVWTPLIGGWLAGLFTGELDGGNERPEAKPLYSIAKALAARGKFAEAVAEIQAQLGKFPTDYEGQMLLAEIQAKNLNDLMAAETTIQNLCDQPRQSANNVAAALTALADWHLKLARDCAAAGRCLEQIGALFPDSDFSAAAAQRIAQLGDAELVRPPSDRPKYPVPEGIKSYGLRSEPGLIQPRTNRPEEQAAQFVKQLEAHPLDTEAREKLALLYAEHYHRLDLATLQLEQLIAAPNQPPRQVVRWLNLLADLQVHHGGDYAAARATLQQIVDRFPNLAAAELARNRIALLRLETKGQTQTAAVKLGVYEQNPGLKMNPPRYRS